MTKSVQAAVTACVLAAFCMCASAQSTKTEPLPKAPAPVKQSLPFDAQPSNGGVYVPLTKSGNVGVSAQPLKNPVSPSDKGGSVGITIKTP